MRPLVRVRKGWCPEREVEHGARYDRGTRTQGGTRVEYGILQNRIRTSFQECTVAGVS